VCVGGDIANSQTGRRKSSEQRMSQRKVFMYRKTSGAQMTHMPADQKEPRGGGTMMM
jgi:hypothetical protein